MCRAVEERERARARAREREKERERERKKEREGECRNQVRGGTYASNPTKVTFEGRSWSCRTPMLQVDACPARINSFHAASHQTVSKEVRHYRTNSPSHMTMPNTGLPSNLPRNSVEIGTSPLAFVPSTMSCANGVVTIAVMLLQSALPPSARE